MSSKRVLPLFKIADAQSISASQTFPATTIDYLDNVAYQINITTAACQGTFVVQGSLDYVPAGPTTSPTVAGNWVDLTLSGTPAVSAANDSILINLNQVPYKALRLKYTASVGGVGTATIYISAKGLS